MREARDTRFLMEYFQSSADGESQPPPYIPMSITYTENVLLLEYSQPVDFNSIT